jgi:hypothetical protein
MLRKLLFLYHDNFSEKLNYQIIARSNTAKKPDNFLAFFFATTIGNIGYIENMENVH